MSDRAIPLLLSFAIFLAMVSACTESGSPVETALIDDARLRIADDDGANWLMYGRTYNEHRFSPLDLLYARLCARCHGANAIAGPVRDLRYSTAAVHAQFDAIVRGGAMESLGMPAFADQINAEQARAIQAYVLSRARSKPE